MHGVEEYAEVPYVLGNPITYTIIDGDKRYNTEHRRHAFDSLEQRYDRVADVLALPELIRGSVFGAECWLIEVEALWEKCAAKMSDEPYYFVESV